jgi:hypothetical protein
MSSNRLPELRTQARAAHDGVVWHRGEAAEKALQAGALLIEARALCRHGEWADWLKSTGIPQRSASRYITLRKAGLKSATVAEMGFAEAERLATAGLKMIPAAGHAIESIGWQHGKAVTLAYWWSTEPELFNYFSVSLLDNSMADTRRPVPRLALLLTHQKSVGDLDSEDRREIEIGEAIKFQRELVGVRTLP